jgi:hypothetical protein
LTAPAARTTARQGTRSVAPLAASRTSTASTRFRAPDHSSCKTFAPNRTVSRPDASAGLIMRTNELNTVPLNVTVVCAP